MNTQQGHGKVNFLLTAKTKSKLQTKQHTFQICIAYLHAHMLCKIQFRSINIPRMKRFYMWKSVNLHNKNVIFTQIMFNL